MSHFGEWISASVDGQLTQPQEQRLAMHVAQCHACALELAAERDARAALLGAGDLPVHPDLTARLLRLAQDSGGAHTPLTSQRRPTPAALAHQDEARFPALTGQVGAKRTHRRVLFGAGAGLLIGGGLLLGLGQPATVIPDADQGAALTILAGGGTSAGNTVQVDMRGGDGLVVVREHAGRLDQDAAQAMPVELIDGRNVFVLSQDPWHAVWQADQSVIEVVSAHRSAAVTELLATFPDEKFHDSLDRRIARGWRALSGMWTN